MNMLPQQTHRPRPRTALRNQMALATLTALQLTVIFLVTACTIGPSYERPSVQTPKSFKENRGWVQAAPLAVPFHGAWWRIFGDSKLDALEPRVVSSNQSLRSSYYAYQQALALTNEVRAVEFPTAGGYVSSSRSSSSGASGIVTSIPGGISTQSIAGTSSAGLTASWTPDFWGKVRQQITVNAASAEASRDTLLAAQLSLQSTLAQDFFQIRQIDSQIRLAQDTVTSYKKFLQLTKNRYTAGVASQGDVAQAQSQLANARVQVVAYGVQRAQLEHAIAVLIGEPPSNFTLPSMAVLPKPRPIPSGLPSSLLLRRPDLASAERQVAAANAQIGVTESAFFPSFTLSGQRGVRSSSLANLISAPTTFWSIGPTLAATLLDFGARSAAVAQSKNVYRQMIAQYRQLSLQAFEQVEDQLSTLDVLANQAVLQQQAVTAAEKSLRVAINQYKAGTVSYLNVLSAQIVLFNAKNSAIQIAGQRLVANVALIQALGGAWGNSGLSGPESQ